MTDYAYRLLNVFTLAGNRLSGNPLCVFEDGRGVDSMTMQALARQFNLSETTFIFPSEKASAAVRIFTPNYEMPFAGHPTLGTAHVVRTVRGAGDAVTLEMKAGVIPVTAEGDHWTLEANAPRYREVDATPAQLAEMLGLPLRVKVAIKVTIRVRPPVVTPPAVRVNPYTPLSRRRYCPSGSVPMTTTPKGTRGPLVVVVTPLGTTRTTRAPAPRAAPRAL